MDKFSLGMTLVAEERYALAKAKDELFLIYLLLGGDE